MTRSTITLPDGTSIVIDGSVEEIKKVMSLYPGQQSGKPLNSAVKESHISNQNKKGRDDLIINLVNTIKDLNDIDSIEKNILDKASQVNRVLLPLFVMDRNYKSKHSLTSNDIHKILKELGISIALPNISKTLKTTARKYVIADKATKKYESTPYKISLKGKQYISQTLNN